MNKSFFRFALAVIVVMLNQSVFGQENVSCSSLPSAISAVFERHQVSDFSEVKEESFFNDERTDVYIKFDLCVNYLNHQAEQAKNKAKSELFRQKAEASAQIARGTESILNGAKLICVNSVSQGSQLQEFVCYKRITESLAEVLSQ